VVFLVVKVCFETVGACEVEEVILKDFTLPKMKCTWDETYNIKGL
jgi:hypothetical protein